MKKGRHRRYEEARRAKRFAEVVVQRCAECGAGPEDDHASWCLAEAELEEAEPVTADLPTAGAPVASGHASVASPGSDLQPASRAAPDPTAQPGSAD